MPSDRFPMLAKLPPSDAFVADEFARSLDALIVEDYGAMRRSRELALGQFEHLMLAVGSLRETCSMLSTFKINVVVSDLLLPDGDASERIRAWPTNARRMPEVAMSGWSDPGLGERCRRAGSTRSSRSRC